MEKVSIKVYAKANLVLKVCGVDSRGYHLLDSITVPIRDIFDTVSVSKRCDDKIVVSFTDGRIIENNTALKMGQILKSRYATAGVEIIIDKGIPMSSGLGGSSADAAGVARAMEKLFGFKTDITDLIAVGADVPVLYFGRPARMCGTGEVLSEIGLADYDLVVVSGGQGLSSRQIYAEYDRIGGEDGDVDCVLSGLAKGCADLHLFNALERAAANHDVVTKRANLEEAGYKMIVMSGSGDAVVALSRPGEGNRTKLLESFKGTGYCTIFTGIKG